MDGLERLATVPARRVTERHPTLVRASAYAMADMMAVVVAWLGAAPALQAAALPGLTEGIEPLSLVGLLWLVSAVCVVAWLAPRRHHNLRLAWNTQLSDVLAGSAVALGGSAVAGTLARMLGDAGSHPLSAGQMVSSVWVASWLTSWMIFVPALMATRTLARGVLRSAGFWTLRTVIVAPRAAAEKVEAALRSNHRLGFAVVGHVDPADARQSAQWRLVDPTMADLVIVATDFDRAELVEQTINELRLTGLPVATTLVHPGLSGLSNRHRAFSGHDVVLVPSLREPSTPVGGWAKQCMDKIGAAILLLVLAPLFVLLAALIRRDGGDALFRHQRLGASGRMFPCMKFRSMVANSDRVLEQLLASDPAAAAEWNATQKLRRDPRVTSVGRFLRKTSLDELPQLFNVLRGEMSLVGPRPIVRAEIVRYGSEIRYYYQARPGLTGLWQVSGRSDTSYAQRVELDVRYVANWTFWRDVAIVLKTIPAVILRKGAV